jgi:hypothetical protein
MIGTLVRREELSPEVEGEMYRLFDRHFEGVGHARFAADLAEKNWVLLLSDEAERLMGFSTLLFYTVSWQGQPYSIVYSGDTIVDPAAWNSSVLSRSWIESVLRLHAEHGQGPLLWLLITSGFRTYRLLTLFWREFHPRYDRETPEATRRLVDHLARQRFGERYDAAAGVVRFAEPQRLREHLTGIPDKRREDPHVAFFARANPGFERGDELVCLAELSSANLTPAGRRMVAAGAVRGVREGVTL